MDQLLALLKAWQTLTGAFLSGVFALLVALLVASKARRHEEEAAAMLLIAEMKPFEVAAKSLLQILKNEEGSEQDKLLRMAARFRSIRPQRSPLFDSYMARIMPVDRHLSAFLAIFRLHVSSAEQGFSRLSELDGIMEEYRKTGKVIPIRYPYEFEASAKSAAKHMEAAAELARWAIPLLESLFLTRTPTFRRLLRRIWKPRSEKQFLLATKPEDKSN